MTIEMVLQIPVEKLSTYRTVMIEAYVNNVACGTVLNVKQEIAQGIFNCDVLVYPKHETRVLDDFERHSKKMNR